jgi:LysR family transcriptional regulator for bpeEF and oprC
MRFHRENEAIEVVAPTGVSVNESTAHLTALLSGLGISQTFQYMARSYVERGALVPLLTDWTRPAYQLNLLYPPTRQLSAKLRVFIDWTVEVFQQFSAPSQ